MGYYQMVYQYGEKKFIKKCKQVGVNGLIIVDLPWPDNKNFLNYVKKFNYFRSAIIANNIKGKNEKNHSKFA